MNPLRILLTLLAAGSLLGTQLRAEPTTTNQLPAGLAITNTVTWTATNVYLMTGPVYVLSNGVLNIEAGTIIKGRDSTTNAASIAAVYVCTGGKIFANGTATRPIIFTAEKDNTDDPFDMGLYERGLWGGIIIMGNAVLNTASDAAGNAASPKYDIYEGLAAATAVNGQQVYKFGGNNDDDSSGSMRYVSVRHGGKKLETNKELNGISLCAVGRGTTLEFLEAYATADDGFEWFGGTVNAKHLVSAFNDDDSFDTDQGYSGKLQFLFSIQESGVRDKGLELNGEPSGIAVGNLPRGKFTVYNLTSIGAGTNSGGSGNNAITIREFASPSIYNSIFTDYAQRGVTIDKTSYTNLLNGDSDFKDNIWWGFTGGNTIANICVSNDFQYVFTNAGFNNDIVNPQLRAIGRLAGSNLDPRPLPGSPALSSARTAPNDGFFEPVAYKGAFDTNDLWASGWTALWQYGIIRHTEGVTNVLPAGLAITGVTNWNRDQVYLMTGPVYVLSNGVLNIDAGAIIKGRDSTTNSSTIAALYVCTGGRIYANGTANSPIIFTAEKDNTEDPFDMGLYERGLWGGIILMGNAVLNTASDAAGNAASPKFDIYEGLPAATIVSNQQVYRFGGSNDDDNSGVLRYVSVRHGGKKLETNKELNGMSFCAVGRGTTLEFLEAYATADDGFEWFGGTVNARYLVSAFNDDDSFDSDQGYRGKQQFLFSIQEPGVRDKGLELNGEPSGIAVGAQPRATFVCYNLTSIGAGTNGGGSGNNAITIREFASPTYFNSIFTDYSQRGVTIDKTSYTNLLNGSSDFRDNVWWGFGTNANANSITNICVSNDFQVVFTDVARNNQITNPQITRIARDVDGGLDPRPLPGSPALSGSRTPPVNDPFYTQVAYKGAFGSQNWAADWTALSAYYVMSGNGGGTPTEQFFRPSINSALVVGGGGNAFQVSFATSAGWNYQVQASTNLVNWTNLGAVINGSGAIKQVIDSPVADAAKYYRVRGLRP